MNIIIITPCSRPENLPKLLASINFPCRWVIVFDSSVNYFAHCAKFADISWVHTMYKVSKPSWGKPQVNAALDLIQFFYSDAWIYVLDDDNIMHPDFFDKLNSWDNRMSLKMKDRAIVFGQLLPDESIRPQKNIFPGHIDQGQFLVHTSIIGNNRYIENCYEADGHFIDTLYKENKDLFVFSNHVISYYNFLTK